MNNRTSEQRQKKSYKHLFGPVPSRRLGRSLGVDIVPLKTCSFDCVFCQVGRTTELTVRRGIYVDTEEVLDELTRWLSSGDTADYITLSGSGEPTLHTEFGRLIEFVKEKSIIPAALLTNGSLLHMPEVRADALKADVVKVSLSAWDESSFRAINRPEPGLMYDKVYRGIKKFSEDFFGELWVEVFLVAGVNDKLEQVENIAAQVNALNADVVHLNTVVRPPSERWAKPASEDNMEKLAELFKPSAELIGFRTQEPTGSEWTAHRDRIVGMLSRRPCTAEDIAAVSGLHPNEVAKYLAELGASGLVKSEERGGLLFYIMKSSG